MYGPRQRNAIAAYNSVGVETGVAAANPHELIVMLFDGAILCVASARQNMTSGGTAAKGESISRAINIVANGLKASLNLEVGGELALRLAALYDYMCDRLLYANLKNDAAALDEVRGLLEDLKGAWEQIEE
jgi:flagellar protein FliS